MSKHPLQNVSALLIEDNPHYNMILRTVLAGFGIRKVYESKDPVRALEMIHQHCIDVVITDLAMPFFDGFEVIHTIRNASDSKNPYVPIIVLSSHAHLKNVHRARDLGADYFLVKPIIPRDLAEALEWLINIKERNFVRTDTYFGPDRRSFRRGAYEGQERRKPAEDRPSEGLFVTD